MKLSAPTAGVDDRTDDCASGADDVAGRPKFKFLRFQMTVNKMFDATNQKLGAIPGKKVSLGDLPTRLMFSFTPDTLHAGIYRIDVLWNDHAVWRTFFTLVE